MRIAVLVAAILVPLVAYAKAPVSQCMLDIEIGGRCATDWMIRAFVASAAVVLIGLVWRSLTARAGMKDWHEEQEITERRGAELGDLGPVAAANPTEAARILQRQLGTGAADYARRQRRLAFKKDDVAAAGAWHDVERLIERQFGAD